MQGPRARGVTESDLGVFGGGGWRMSGWSGVVIPARVVGEYGGKEEVSSWSVSTKMLSLIQFLK